MATDPSLSALASAVEVEKQSLDGYLRLAWQTRDEAGRGMLLRLAMDEFGHMRLLEGQQASLVRNGRWLASVPERSPLPDLVPRLSRADIRIRGAAGTDQLTALNAALELEERGRRLYSGLMESAADADTREMFRSLAEMEAGHAALVQAEIDNIQQTGFWFGLPEFTLEAER